MRIVMISDTHALHKRVTLPPGDMLIHAGDLTRKGALGEVDSFDRWLAEQPHRHKVVIAGNHDFCFEHRCSEARALLGHAVYLQDQGVTLEGIKIYGSPWQPEFFDWAFNLPRGQKLRQKWAMIPDDTDLLITHGPPFGQRDRTERGEVVGCEDLLRRIEQVRPRLHVFGHIHEASGVSTDGRTTFVNASICDLGYRPVNPPLVFDWEAGRVLEPGE